MSKYNRNRHKEIMGLMEEATFAIVSLVQAGSISEVPQVLVDCQDTAVALGTHIEQLYGMQTQTVAMLEEYCNALYQVSVSMDENSLTILQEAMEKIQMTYTAEFPEKKKWFFYHIMHLCGIH